MELRVLRYIVAIADTGTMTAAAHRELVAQPSLSRQVRNLENELGIEIFRRVGASLRITPLGEKFIHKARDLVLQADSLAGAAKSGFTVEDISVVCAPQLFDTLVAPSALDGKFSPTSIVIRDSFQIPSFVNQGFADLGISPVMADESLRSSAFTWTPLTIQVHPKVDPFLSQQVHIKEIESMLQTEIVSLSPSRETRKVFDQLCIAAGLNVRVSREVETAQVAQLYAATRQCACIVTSDRPQFGLKSHTIVSDSGTVSLPIFGIWKPEHALDAEIRTLIAGLDN